MEKAERVYRRVPENGFSKPRPKTTAAYGFIVTPLGAFLRQATGVSQPIVWRRCGSVSALAATAHQHAKSDEPLASRRRETGNARCLRILSGGAGIEDVMI